MAADPAFEKVPTKVSYIGIERAILERWEQEQTFAKLRAKNAGGPTWSFLDGPITANNPMGVHHAWGRTYKDTFQRYHAMTGHELRYQNGFDCQGLWVEVEVEKSLGFKAKREVIDYGIERFVAECKKRVLTFAARMTRQSIRLGYWMDWDDPAELEKLAAAITENAEVTYRTASGELVTGAAEGIVAELGKPGWGGSYFTFSTNNNETIWTFLKRCFERGKLYRGHDVMPWSGRSGSAYSQMEIADGRKLTVHTSVFVRLPLIDRENEYLLVWTTTPWTLTSNVAAAVNPELDYARVRSNRDGKVTYLAADNLEFKRLEKEYKEGFGKPDWSWPKDEKGKKGAPLKTLAQLFKEQGGFEVLGTVKGAELVGERYRGPFDELPAQQADGGLPQDEALAGQSGVSCHRVIDGGRDSRGKPNVVAGEGTGIVHIAPGCGDIDYRIGKELGLVRIAPLDEEGRFVEGFGEFTGLEAIDRGTPERVIESLKSKDLLFAREEYPHVYPHCWRNKDELIFRLVDEWFINMDWRDEIKEVTRQIRWLPEEMEGQEKELEWLTNMRDWMISKKRFWGLALPIWVDEETGDFEVIGTLAELKERAVEGWEVLEGHSPHRPYIDAVKLRNPKTGNLMSRIKDVGNPWLDAGIVPYSTMSYNEDREEWKRWFPANFITECFPGQFRNWFYALLAMSTMMENRPPFEAILGHALVRDEHGEEMHKSAGNSIPFEDAAEKMGADVMRWMYCSQPPGQNLNFGYKPADETRSRVFDTLWNTYAFFCNYARLDAYVPGAQAVVPVASRPEIDRWLLSNLQLLIREARRGYESFDLSPFMKSAEGFIDDLSNWYLRRNRRRFWRGEAGEDKQAAYDTLHEALVTLCQLLAPVIPFLSDELYRSLSVGGEESVHLCAFPEADEGLIDDGLSARMTEAMRIVKMGRSVRMANKLRTRQPLKTLTLVTANPVQVEAAEQMRELILEEVNVKQLEVLQDAKGLVEYDLRPNFPRLGPRYGKHMKAIQAALQAADGAALAARQRAGEATVIEAGGESIALEPEDILIRFQWQEGFTGADEQGALVALDTRLTPELEREGRSRDLIRYLQEARKAAGFEPQDRIHIRARTESAVLSEAIAEWREVIMGEVLCTGWRDELGEGEATRLDIDGEVLEVQLEKA